MKTPGYQVQVIAPLSGLLVLFGLLYLPVLRDLGYVWWTDPNYSHGILIPFIAGYLIWRRRKTLAEAAVKSSLWGEAILVAGLCLRLLGDLVDTVGAGTGGLFVKGISLMVVLAGLVLSLLGTDFFKRLVLPLGYLLFMLPLPAGAFALMTLSLQTWATAMTASALNLIGIPALREGNLIALPSMTLGVVEACSGIRSLFSLLALAGAIALLFFPPQQWWRQLLLVSSAVPIAVAANALRITATGVLAHFGGSEVASGFYHDLSGWVAFLAAFLLLCSEGFLLTHFSKPAAEGPA